MLGLSSMFLFNLFYMYFATRPRPALTTVCEYLIFVVWKLVRKTNVIAEKKM